MKFRITAVAVAAVAATALATTLTTTATADAANHRPLSRWTATWASAMQAAAETAGPNWSASGFDNQTLRETLRVSAGGNHVRVRLSNRYGDRPLHVIGATIARTGNTGATVAPRTAKSLTFHGQRSTTIAAGAVAASDGTPFAVSPLESLTVTLFLAGATGPATFHEDGLTTTYRAAGDHRFDTGAAAFAGDTSHSFYYLTGLDVTGADVTGIGVTGIGATGEHPAGTVVAFGDSITNGHNSTVDGFDRYTDALADRLAAAGSRLGLANLGISGNTLLNELPCFGEDGLTRFGRDALDQPGVRTVILLEGENDIWDSEGNFGPCGETPRVTAEQIIAGYQTLIRAAHARGIRVIGATILPFKAPFIDAPAFQRAEAVRDQVNSWVLTSGAYDAVVDFAGAVADPADPQQLNPAYNSGDFLHPDDAGYKAIAAAFHLADL